jgi:hypothetical protein
MKKIMIFLCILFLMFLVTIQIAFGQNYNQYFTKDDNVTFQWDYSTPDPDLLGFNLYYKNIVGGSVTKINIPNVITSFIVKHYPTGSFLNWVTAYDKFGNESDNSTKIQVNKKTIKPSMPTTLRISNPAFVITITP